MGSISLIRDVWQPCNCTELCEKDNVAQGCVRRRIIREASEVFAGGKALPGTLCLVQDTHQEKSKLIVKSREDSNNREQ